MFKKKISISIYLSLLVIIISCKKYEENPLINLDSKKYRLTAGPYSHFVAGYWVDGIDSTSLLNNYLSSVKNGDKCFVSFGEDSQSHKKFISSRCIQGEWDFSPNKKELLVKINYNSEIGPFVVRNKQLNWKINKLTKHQLHLSIDYSGKKYILYLHKGE